RCARQPARARPAKPMKSIAQIEGSGTAEETSRDTPPSLSPKKTSCTWRFTAVGEASVNSIGPGNGEYAALLSGSVLGAANNPPNASAYWYAANDPKAVE